MTRQNYARTASRRAAILELAQDREVSITELADRFSVTVSTIRRDVAQLAEGRLVSRTYGGVTVSAPRSELDISRKAQQHRTEKADIARVAAERIHPGDVVLIDAGTTAGRLATALREMKLTVVTGGMNALLALHDAPAVDLIVIGGRLRHVNQGMVGSLAEHGLSYIHADSAFLGAEGLDAELGIACPTLEQATLKRHMMESARDVFVLADHSKLDRSPFNYWAKLPDGVTVITDAGAKDETVEKMSRRWNVAVASAGAGVQDGDTS